MPKDSFEQAVPREVPIGNSRGNHEQFTWPISAKSDFGKRVRLITAYLKVAFKKKGNTAAANHKQREAPQLPS